jgi:hypothetical protein
MKFNEQYAGVIEATRSVTADARNSFQKYDYISADKVLGVVGGAMAEAGLAIIPSVLKTDIHWNDSAKGMFVAEVTMSMQVVYTEGESTDHLWVGVGVDYASPDKAVYKAITSGHKYFLMKLFCFGVGNEDGEHDEPTEKQKATATTPKHKNVTSFFDANGEIIEVNDTVNVAGKTATVQGEVEQIVSLGDGIYSVKVNIDGSSYVVSSDRVTALD